MSLKTLGCACGCQIILAGLFAATAVGTQVAVFGYEADRPVSIEERGRDAVGEVSVRDISFEGPKGGDVTAYLVVPPGPGPFAGVLFLHWGAGDRTQFLSESLLLAKAGVVSLMIDAPHNRPNWSPVALGMDPDGEREYFVQVVVELRRAVDVLSDLPYVDAARLGFVGHSLGGTVGGAFAAADERIGALVLMGGLPRPSPFPGQGDEVSQRYEEVFASISSEALIGQATSASVLFQFGRYDRHVSEEQARVYVEAASEPKEARWYVTSHEFNDPDSQRDRLLWLAVNLRLDPALLRGG